jgi:hypothetical protein
MEDVTGASALELAPSGRGDLVVQLNEAAKRPRFGRWALAAVIVLFFIKPPVGTILALVASPGVVWLFFHDRARRSVVAFYDVNDEAAHWFQRVITACEETAKMARRWRINTSGDVRTTYQYKVNSGASTIVSRSAVAITMAGPKQLKTNVVVPTISAGKNALHFLPDRLLVSDGKRFSDVAYASLDVDSGNGRFIESDGVPRDGTKVDTTWQYVNVKGGPDRRYNNNLELPVMLYGYLGLASPSGLNWLLQCSKADGFEEVARELLASPKSLEQHDEVNGNAPARENSQVVAAAETPADRERLLPAGATYREDGAGPVFSKIITVEDTNGAANNSSEADASLPAPEVAGDTTAHASDDSASAGSPYDTEPDQSAREHAVPRTAEERTRVLTERPPGWEYLLFGSFLLAGLERLEPKWRDHQLGYASTRGRELNAEKAMAMLSDAFDEVTDDAGKLMQLLSPAALEPAFGQPGEPGDPALIEHLCRRFIDVYEALLDWAARFRAARVPLLFQPVFETASRFVDKPLETIREFVQANVRELDRLPERMKNEGTITIQMILTLEIDDDVVREFEQRMAAVQASI